MEEYFPGVILVCADFYIPACDRERVGWGHAVEDVVDNNRVILFYLTFVF